jgi:hypothetical protein
MRRNGHVIQCIECTVVREWLVIALMKRSAIIVNTARSGLINEKEMIDALRSGQIMGAGLGELLNASMVLPAICGVMVTLFSV